jgi:hypothetical protein
MLTLIVVEPEEKITPWYTKRVEKAYDTAKVQEFMKKKRVEVSKKMKEEKTAKSVWRSERKKMLEVWHFMLLTI